MYICIFTYMYICTHTHIHVYTYARCSVLQCTAADSNNSHLQRLANTLDMLALFDTLRGTSLGAMILAFSRMSLRSTASRSTAVIISRAGVS